MNIFTKKDWEQLGKLKHAKKWIGLPRVSWSQIETFNDSKGFNTGLLGRWEWMRNKLLGEEYKDMGWGDFGSEVQEYVQERKHAEKFSPEEKQTLDIIKPLDIYEQPVVLNINNVIVTGYIDDMSKDWKKIRDFKTKSENSMKDLFSGKKYQMELYSLFVLQEKGFLPKCSYVIIEREGGAECMRGGGRECLKVGKRVWYEDYPISEERLGDTKKLVIKTSEEMQKIIEVFNKINKL